MEYAGLATRYREIEAADADSEKRRLVAATLADAGDELPRLVTLVRGNLSPAWHTGELGVSSALATEAIARATGVPEAEVEAAWRETGDLGDAAARAVENRTQQTLGVAGDALTVERVHETLSELPGYEGEGSRERRVDAVVDLLADADPEEARYLVRTVVDALRIGVGEGAIRDAVADAFLDGSPAAVEAVERAYQVTNDFTVVAETAREEGTAGLAALDIDLFRPVKAMLATTAESAEAALADVGDGYCEYKYDGMRVQIHADGDDVGLFTRRLEDVTEQFPDVVAAVTERLDAGTAVLEGEVVGQDPETGDPLPFQKLSRRIKREHGIAAVAEEVPAVTYLFDALSLDGDPLLDRPLRARLDRLDAAFDHESDRIERAAHRVVDGPPDAQAFYEAAIEDGQEGIIAKDRTAAYEPGSRVGRMVKVKPTMEPLDLVVTRAMWGEGRRSDWLGRLYLACRDGDDFREVGRMSSGVTDAGLRELTAELEPLIRRESGREVELRPEVVVEVEYEEIQESPTYGSGYALRFPRFLRRREDLGPEGVDSIDRVRALYEGQ